MCSGPVAQHLVRPKTHPRQSSPMYSLARPQAVVESTLNGRRPPQHRTAAEFSISVAGDPLIEVSEMKKHTRFRYGRLAAGATT